MQPQQSLDQIFGKNTAPTSATVNPAVKSSLDAIFKGASSNAQTQPDVMSTLDSIFKNTSTPAVTTPQPTYMDRVANVVGDTVKKIASDLNKRGQNIAAIPDQTGEKIANYSNPYSNNFQDKSGSIANTTSELGKAGAHAVGQLGAGVGDLFVDIFHGIKAALPESVRQSQGYQDLKSAFKIENLDPHIKQLLGNLGIIAQKNPEISSALQDALDSTGLLVPSASKVLESKIVPIIDETINTAKQAKNTAVQATGNTIQKGMNAVENVATKVKNAGVDMAQNAEKQAWQKPTTIPKASYNKATDIYNNAKSQGHDISETLSNNKINLGNNTTKTGFGKSVYDTSATADKLRADTVRASNEILRPSLQKADAMGAPKTPVRNIINDAKNNLNNNKSIVQETKDKLLGQLDETQNALEAKHPDGMSLEQMHDEKIVRDLNSKYNKLGDIASNNEATKNKALADAFRTSVETHAPKDIPVHEFNQELTKQYQAADYLDALHEKPVPTTIKSHIANTTAKFVGATVGHSLGGGIVASVGGYHIGGMVESMIEGMPNPVRNYFLQNVKTSNPEVFSQLKTYLESKGIVVPETPLTLPAILDKTGVMDMGSYKLGKNTVTKRVEPTGKYRKPGVNFYKK